MTYLPFIGGAMIALGFWGWPVGRAVPAVGDPSTYTMRGNISGLETGWVLMYHPADGPTDSAAVKHGHFELTGKVTGTEFCHLAFKSAHGDNLQSMAFFLEPGNIEVRGNKDTLSAVSFTGAAVQDEYQKFLSMEFRLIDWGGWNSAYQAALRKKDKVIMDSLEAAYRVLEERQQKITEAYVADHPDSYVSVEEILNCFSYNPDADTLERIFNGLAPAIQSSYLGKELKSILDAALLTGIGRPAPVFTQTDVKGKPVTLESFKGQYVLIDFWASWCGPCRAENPNVLKNYREYHRRGFTVLGVSLDDKKDKWLAAIREDRLPWIQVSDLKGWKNDAAVEYGVEGIPMNFLLDKGGKIIAKGLRGLELDKQLKESVH